MSGGAGNDLIRSTDDATFFDYSQATYRSSTSGISAAVNGIGGLIVQDGLGGTDTLQGVHQIFDSKFDDTISADGTYQTSFGSFLEVRLSAGDDLVTFTGGITGRIGYAGADGGVLAHLGAGTATDLNASDNFIGNDTFIGAISLFRGSSFADDIIGSSGDDHIRGMGGNDTIDGRAGFDEIQFAASNSGVNVNLAKNKVLNDGDGGHDTVTHIEAVRGSPFNDIIAGNGAGNLLRGELGNDTIHGKNGADTITGDSGIDSDAASGGFTSNDKLYGDAGNDRIFGGAGADHLFGGGGNDYLESGWTFARFDPVNNAYLFYQQDTLQGDAGNDTLDATSGDVQMIGGAGNDLIMATDDGSYLDFTRVSYRSSTSGISVAADGMGGLTVQDGLGGTDTVQGVHALYDSSHDDTISADGTYQTSFGSFIEVRLTAGDDMVTFTGGIAGRIGYQGGGGGVLADLNAGTATDLNAGDNFIGNDTFIGTVGVLRGSYFADDLLGSSGDDRIRGEGGNDTIDGRGGFDRIEFGGSNSGVNVNLAKGKVFNDGLGGHDTVMHIEAVAGSDFNDVISGNGAGNLLLGNLGNDTIHGRNGADTISGDSGISGEAVSAGFPSEDSLYGDGGGDRLFGGASADHLFGGGGGGNDYLESGGTFARFDPVNNTYLFYLQDTLQGDAGNDTLNATNGDVVMIGGGGNDLIMATDDGSYLDFTRVDYRSSTSGISVAADGMGGLTVQDGLGGTDTVQGVHVLYDSSHDDTISADGDLPDQLRQLPRGAPVGGRRHGDLYRRHRRPYQLSAGWRRRARRSQCRHRHRSQCGRQLHRQRYLYRHRGGVARIGFRRRAPRLVRRQPPARRRGQRHHRRTRWLRPHRVLRLRFRRQCQPRPEQGERRRPRRTRHGDAYRGGRRLGLQRRHLRQWRRQPAHGQSRQ